MAHATERLGRMKAPYDKKTKAIRSKMHPQALYGCQFAPVNGAALRQYRAATATAITYTTTQRSVDLTITVASQGIGLGPEVYIVVKKDYGI